MNWNRRDLARAFGALIPAGLVLPTRRERHLAHRGAQETEQMAQGITLTSVEGIRVGHTTRRDRPTGCTAILLPDRTTAGVAVRGAAPGTRDLALLEPENTVEEIHGIVLAGGSAFGLAAADGVMRYLSGTGVGFAITGGPVPIVPAAILFDLNIGDGQARPTADDGFAAAQNATRDPVAQGSVGAGAGATIGKLGFGLPMKGGIGSAGYLFEDGTVIAALVATNGLGDVRDPRTGQIVAGAVNPEGEFVDAEARFLRGEMPPGFNSGPGQNTTIGVVATNRRLTKTQCSRLASIAHDGLARAVVPAHTRMDGDTLFCVATNEAAPLRDGEFGRIDTAVAAAVSAAILSAVRSATSLPGYPSVSGL